MSRLGLRVWGDFEPMAVEEVGAAGTDDGLAVRRATGGAAGGARGEEEE
jgi:hypothetical protein